ncbi:MAG: ABC transporter ATP-binding protein, partial [Peptoniphilus harei]|nr:ABC transporter ATP-binding protein [Peptoniphilus harei]
MEIVRTENLSKTYGSGENLVKAIDDVNLKIEKGEFIAIVG